MFAMQCLPHFLLEAFYAHISQSNEAKYITYTYLESLNHKLSYDTSLGIFRNKKCNRGTRQVNSADAAVQIRKPAF